MGENRKYFWLKLYNDFFSSKRIKRLRSLAGGDTYTIIYLKMQLKALKDDGYLYFDGVMEDFAEELALDIDESPDDVRVTIQYLSKVGLLESSEDGKEYFLTYVQKCIGSETASTQRSRLSRARKKEQEVLQCNADATPLQQIETPMQQLETKCNTEIEKEIEKDKEIEKEKRGEDKPRNVFKPPTVDEVKDYCWERKNGINAQSFIDFYSSKGWKIGKNKMKDWKAAVRTWEQRNGGRQEQKQSSFFRVDDDFFRRKMEGL